MMSVLTHSSPGGPCVIMAAPNLKNKHFAEVQRLHLDEGMTLSAIGRHLDIHPVTLGKWFKAEGIKTRQSGYKQHQVARAAKVGDTKVVKPCRRCGQDFEDYEYRNRAFCSRDCTNDWQRENGDRRQSWCPCGVEITKNPWQNKYCSAECRMLHGKKRQANPENHATFTCLNCGSSVTRRKGLGYHKYCSNACANRHTKTKQHIVVDDAVVLDSSWEGLFWGLCGLLKLPVERFDREQGVEWAPGFWYAPDFWLPTLGIAVEIKGVEDPGDATRWATFREHTSLAVVQKGELDALRRTDDLAGLLKEISTRP